MDFGCFPTRGSTHGSSKNRVLNHRYPEATVVETYRLFEWTHFLHISGSMPEGALTIPVSSEKEAEPQEPDLAMHALAHTQTIQLQENHLKKLKEY